MNFQELFGALNERRAWRWLIAYAAAAWGLTEATGFLIDTYGASRTLLDVLIFLIVACFPILLTLVWYHGAKGHQRLTRAESVILAVLVAVAAIGSVWIATGEAAPRAAALAVEEPVVDLGEGSVAVLPFNNSLEDEGLEWLDRGLAELVATHLAQLDGLRVVSAQRISDLLRQNGMGELRQVPVGLEPQITRLAGARLMVTGSVYGRRESLAITANLADARTGEILASANARGSDVFAVVDSISLAMSRQISGVPLPTELASAAQLTTTNIEAYREYQAGREAFQRFLDGEAAGHFRRAVELDPEFALAHFRLGMALARLGNQAESLEHFTLARENLTAVSERDSLFIEGVWAQAFEPERSDATLRELIRKYPDEKEVRVMFASILDNRDDPSARAELQNLLEETIRLDPLHAAAYNQLAYVYASAQDYASADSMIRQYVELEPGLPNPHDSRGEILEYSGRFSEARDAYREALRLREDFRPSLEHLARSYIREDRAADGRVELRRYLDSSLPDVQVMAGILVGDTYMWEGAIEEGLDMYEQADRAAVEASRPDLRSRPLEEIVKTHVIFGRYDEASAVFDTLEQLEPLADEWYWIRTETLREAGDVEGLEALKADAAARYTGASIPPQVAQIYSLIADMEIAFVQADYQLVLDLYEELPGHIEGDVPGWIMIRSLLELGLAERAVQILEDLGNPDILDGVARIDPLIWRQGQYLAGRAHEALGDTLSAFEFYDGLLTGFGDAVERIPLMADTRERLEALRASAEAAAARESEGDHR